MKYYLLTTGEIVHDFRNMFVCGDYSPSDNMGWFSGLGCYIKPGEYIMHQGRSDLYLVEAIEYTPHDQRFYALVSGVYSIEEYEWCFNLKLK
jgi:hypothetical protein